MIYKHTYILSKNVLQKRLYAQIFDKSSTFKDSFGGSKPAVKTFEPTVIKLPLFSSQTPDLTKDDGIDWTVSYSGIAEHEISAEQCEILSQPIDPSDIEIKQESLLYLPEIKYRRILSLAFGPGKWALVPRSDHFLIGSRKVARTYALIVNSKFVSEATGEQDFFKEADMITAFEGCKSNALMRCCKDLNIASELWDPVFISKYKASLKSKKPMVNPRNILRPVVAKNITPGSSVIQSIKLQTASKTFVPPRNPVPQQPVLDNLTSLQQDVIVNADSATVNTASVPQPLLNANAVLDKQFMPSTTPIPVTQPTPVRQFTPSTSPTSVRQFTPSIKPAPVRQFTPSTSPTSVRQFTPSMKPIPVRQFTPSTKPIPVRQFTPSTKPIPVSQLTSSTTPLSVGQQNNKVKLAQLSEGPSEPVNKMQRPYGPLKTVYDGANGPKS